VNAVNAKVGAPYVRYAHGNLDTAGAVRAAESITKGMAWQRVHEPVLVSGAPARIDAEACWAFGAAVAATLTG